jgi:cell shape-determining protein MreC
MKMYSSTTKGSYRRNSKGESRQRWLIILIGLFALGLIFPWLFSKAVAVVLYPFHATSLWVKTSDGVLPSYLRSRSELVAELEALKFKNASEAGTELSLRRLLEENMILRSMANAGNAKERIVAKVIARPGVLSYDLLQVDKGASDGVVVGAPIYTGVDTVVGIVVSVHSTYSYVELFTSPGFLSTSYIFGPNVFAPIEGIGGGVARVKLPQGVPINVGQLVILPGVESGVYGEIVSVENEPTQPEQYGYITSPVSINSMLYVSIGNEVIPEREPQDIALDIRKHIESKMRLSSSTLGYLSTSTIMLEGLVPDGEISPSSTLPIIIE